MSGEVRIDPELMERLSEMAESSGRTVSEVANGLLAEALEDIEDCRLCEAAYAEYLRNPVSYTLEESRRRLGLDRGPNPQSPRYPGDIWLLRWRIQASDRVIGASDRSSGTA